MEKGIILKNISKSFGKNKVLDKVSLEFEKGATSVLVGPSGCGKTTILRLVAGLINPDEGEIYINGTLESESKWCLPPHKRSIGFVFQSSGLWPHMTISQNISFGISGSKEHKNEKTNELLNRMEISELSKRYPNQISGGQARRVAIARALAVNPQVLIMDEPLTNLEKKLKDSILEHILNYVNKSKATLLYVTHDLDEAKAVGDQIFELKGVNIV